MKNLRLKANLIVLLFFVVQYLITPINLNPFYAEGASYIVFILSAFLIGNSLTVLKTIKVYQDDRGAMRIDFDKTSRAFKKLISILAVLWGIFFVINIASSPLFNSRAYRDQLGAPAITEFSEDLQMVDLSQIPIVDKALASSLADKKLGENPGMGSQVTLGEPVIQQVNDELVWVVPLEHSGFFKWLKNINGSAGYIKLSATNLKDIEFVPVEIKYQPNSYFFDDITRHIRISNGKVLSGLTDYTFEIDDQGTPYWIITTYKNNWLFALPEATGVLTLNATTGEIAEYSLENVPNWVDRVQPENFITSQINNQGEYVHGIFNFSNQDKFQSSRDEIIIYNNGNCYLFTGLTSVGADESAIGFVMVNMVTKESKLYQMSGATEYASKLSAEGKVQQFGYYATSPIIINQNGVPTYFHTLKDNSGLIKQYAFVSVSDITSVGVGETISDALRDYNRVLGASTSFITPTGDEIELVGTILRIASEVSNSEYKFILEEYPDKIFISSYDLSDELSLTLVGDSVAISYFETDDSIISVSKFDNLEFSQ